MGALAAPAIRYITLAGLPIGASFGALDVALPAFGSAHGSSALGGIFAASLSVGSMLGAVAFGLLAARLGMLREALAAARRLPAAGDRAAAAGDRARWC